MAANNASNVWDGLADIYRQSRHVSADKLIEWPAQLRMADDFQGMRVLDIGCGSGDKARYFAEHGAASVIGIDSSRGFSEAWDRSHAGVSNLELIAGDFEDLERLPAIQGKRFDLVVSFQALMYSRNLPATLKAISRLLEPGGAAVISVPHPFRFAILKNEMEGRGCGFAYQQTQPYRYPSPWKPEMFLEHAMPRVSDYLNAIIAAGLRITACDEPTPTEELRRITPEKAEWMDRYVGVMIIRAVKGWPSSSSSAAERR